MARVQSNIERLTASPYATEVASCRAVGYGSKPCGGPTRFVAASTETTDLAALERQTERYTTLEASYNAREGIVSDCMAVPTPPVSLRGGMCALGL